MSMIISNKEEMYRFLTNRLRKAILNEREQGEGVVKEATKKVRYAQEYVQWNEFNQLLSPMQQSKCQTG